MRAGWLITGLCVAGGAVIGCTQDVAEPALPAPSLGEVAGPPPPPPPSKGVGRMTGGGWQIIVGDVRVTRGFTIHCDIVLSNNLEINWEGNSWHLDKPLTSAACFDDPAVSPEPPVAPFDTFVGEGMGRLNGEDGSRVEFTFVDAGEPGRNDRAEIRIYAPDGTLVLEVPMSNLGGGNLQAHFDQPHGSRANG